MQLSAPFDELAAWISNKWAVTVLNVIYNSRNDLRSSRIEVIVEHHHEAELFHNGYNYDQKKQDAIASKFLEIINREPNHGYDVDGLFVVFSAFSPLAREEADMKISENDIDALKLHIGNPDLWEISRAFGHVTFMFYTDVQVKKYTAKGLKSEYASKYFELLKPNDEFGYLSKESYAVHFDSKQNFDNNYHGSWFYYYR